MDKAHRAHKNSYTVIGTINYMKKFKKILIAISVFILVVVALTFFKLSMPSKERTLFAKKLEVIEILNKFTAMKMDYSIKLLTEELPSGSTSTGFEDFDLENYELKAIEVINSDEGYQYERSIALTAKEIIVTFGSGFDGKQDRTFIFEAIRTGDSSFDWSCKGGSLSNKYRPRRCAH